ncbi:enoyl-CoA hydratase/isomerase family protein [Bradymonadaceae bacterium TMQ3]|nr:enoyl-CoA hydratase/isomerase family protein [Bradymonadaceae bacterium TMQ3]TXC73161.1 enoyl-CoA hydratase/isomerase family protein [Bradymonadales bacterium TMQ1]
MSLSRPILPHEVYRESVFLHRRKGNSRRCKQPPSGDDPRGPLFSARPGLRLAHHHRAHPGAGGLRRPARALKSLGGIRFQPHRPHRGLALRLPRPGGERMSPPIFSTHLDDGGVLHVRMDTPGSEVNIFSARAAEELIALMASVDPQTTRALVFKSAKTRSFINGAQLMLASAVQSPESIFEMTALLRRAYASVKRCPVPTIALVTGSCYGCGVEFSLNCDFRVATDSPDATFYMTEIADYLNTPAFGSTQRLPSMMGLERGLGFLLWGHRLWGKRALEYRLVDALLPLDGIDAALDALIQRILSDQLQPHVPQAEPTDRIARVTEETRALIAGLPDDYHRIYTRCLDLMVHAAHRGTHPPTEDDFRRELAAAGETLVERQAQAARSFLYLRQVAERVHVRRLPLRAPLQLTLQCGVDPHADAFFDELSARPLRHVRYQGVDADTSAPDAPLSLLHAATRDADESGAPPPLAMAIHGGAPPTALPDNEVFQLRRPLPRLTLEANERALPGTGTRPLLEVRLPSSCERAPGHLFEWLDACGFAVIFSRARGTFLSDRFLLATLAPSLAGLRTGLSPADVHATLRHIGMVPSPILSARQSFTPEALEDALTPFLPETWEGPVDQYLRDLLGDRPSAPGTPSEPLDAAIHLNLLAIILSARERGELAHPTVADVIARELLGYPVGRTSLCEHLTPAQLKTMLEQVDPLLLSASHIVLAQAFVEQARAFYV